MKRKWLAIIAFSLLLPFASSCNTANKIIGKEITVEEAKSIFKSILKFTSDNTKELYNFKYSSIQEIVTYEGNNEKVKSQLYRINTTKKEDTYIFNHYTKNYKTGVIDEKEYVLNRGDERYDITEYTSNYVTISQDKEYDINTGLLEKTDSNSEYEYSFYSRGMGNLTVHKLYLGKKSKDVVLERIYKYDNFLFKSHYYKAIDELGNLNIDTYTMKLK